MNEWKEEIKKGTVRFAKTEIGPGEVGTVGAVAIDKYGNLAVATSTGKTTTYLFNLLYTNLFR